MKKALFIGYVWPEPDTTAAGVRMLQLLQSFMGHGYQVTFATTAQKTQYSIELSEFGITTRNIRLNHSSFDDFISPLQPDVVVFDRFMVEEQFGWRVAEFAPNAIRLLNTEDLHSLRSIRQSCLKLNEGFNSQKWLNADATKREVASIYRSDVTLLISEVETQLLINEPKISKNLLLTLPFLLDPITAKSEENWPSFEERQDFIFIGNGKHAPNVDAVKYLKNNIWPLIREQLPSSNLQILGAYLPKQITELHKPGEGFSIKGWVDNLEHTLQKTRVNLAPLRFGAGLKGKVVSALQNGTPTITTSIAAEGVANLQGVDDPVDFAKIAVTCYKDKNTWHTAQKQGIGIINSQFSKENLKSVLFEKLRILEENLKGHRAKNFTGSLLWHQTMTSTKYMAKWIEEKNKTR